MIETLRAPFLNSVVVVAVVVTISSVQLTSVTIPFSVGFKYRTLSLKILSWDHGSLKKKSNYKKSKNFIWYLTPQNSVWLGLLEKYSSNLFTNSGVELTFVLKKSWT